MLHVDKLPSDDFQGVWHLGSIHNGTHIGK